MNKMHVWCMLCGGVFGALCALGVCFVLLGWSRAHIQQQIMPNPEVVAMVNWFTSDSPIEYVYIPALPSECSPPRNLDFIKDEHSPSTQVLRLDPGTPNHAAMLSVLRGIWCVKRVESKRADGVFALDFAPFAVPRKHPDNWCSFIKQRNNFGDVVLQVSSATHPVLFVESNEYHAENTSSSLFFALWWLRPSDLPANRDERSVEEPRRGG